MNPFWGLVLMAGAAFAVTCFAFVAASFGDPQGPMNRLVTTHGTLVIVTETITLVLAGLLAVDRVQTLRRLRSEQNDQVDSDSSRE